MADRIIEKRAEEQAIDGIVPAIKVNAGSDLIPVYKRQSIYLSYLSLNAGWIAQVLSWMLARKRAEVQLRA